MPDQLQLRGGTTVQHSTFTGSSKEVTVDTTKKTAVVHDGSTVGGNPLMREDASNSALALGSAAAPSLKFTGDPNTGIYSPGADQVAVATNGTARLYIASDGKVGAGTTAPTELLHLSGASATALVAASSGVGSIQLTRGTTAFQAYASTSACYIGTTSATDFQLRANNTERLRITSAGLVGIGVSAPATLLEVKSTTTNSARLRVTGTGTTPGNFRGFEFGNGSIFKGGLLQDESTDLVSIFTPVGGQSVNITSGGSVGIGTTSVSSRLHVLNPSGGAGTTEVSTIERDNSGYFLKLYRNAGSGNVGGLIGADSAGTYFTGGHNTSNQLYINSADSTIQFYTNGSERGRFDASGRLLVGTSSAAGGQVEAKTAAVLAGNPAYDKKAFIANIPNSTTNITSSLLAGFDGSSIHGVDIGYRFNSTGGYDLTLATNNSTSGSPTERMRIESTGRTGTYVSASDGFQVSSNAAAGTTHANFVGRHDGGAPFGGTVSLQIWNNGNVQNTNNSYTAISDIKLKENVVDANSQWSDIKALQVRNYNLKEGQTHTQIGLVAQEVELISPGLVGESPDRDEDGNDLGTVTKSVNYSVLYMKAVKALQEAMERIESLEAKVAALESA
jgi:hypothetical protein